VVSLTLSFKTKAMTYYAILIIAVDAPAAGN